MKVVELDLAGGKVHGNLHPGRCGPDEVSGRAHPHRRVLGSELDNEVLFLFKIGSSGGFEYPDDVRSVKFDFDVDATNGGGKAVIGGLHLGEARKSGEKKEKRQYFSHGLLVCFGSVIDFDG